MLFNEIFHLISYSLLIFLLFFLKFILLNQNIFSFFLNLIKLLAKLLLLFLHEFCSLTLFLFFKFTLLLRFFLFLALDIRKLLSLNLFNFFLLIFKFSFLTFQFSLLSFLFLPLFFKSTLSLLFQIFHLLLASLLQLNFYLFISTFTQVFPQVFGFDFFYYIIIFLLFGIVPNLTRSTVGSGR